MLAVYGVLLLASSALLFTWAFGQFRRAAPKKWTTLESMSNAIVLTIIVLFSFGVASLIQAAIGFASSPVTVTDLAMIAAIVGVSVLAGRALRRQAAPHMAAPLAAFAMSRDGIDMLAGAANDSGSGKGPRPASGNRSRRRAA
jgi:hypothetical protein